MEKHFSKRFIAFDILVQCVIVGLTAGALGVLVCWAGACAFRWLLGWSLPVGVCTAYVITSWRFFNRPYVDEDWGGEARLWTAPLYTLLLLLGVVVFLLMHLFGWLYARRRHPPAAR
ncbi:MAG TPA: hypothetical protein VNG90_02510 [Candidatus Acidoferrum sp.]|nr:hypothetical protein [Candidatus Acidoferrum sp.]